MKSYRELADKVFERRDKYFVARKRKRKKIIKRMSASVCALIVVLGISAWHLEWFNPDVDEKTTVYSQTNPQYASPNEHTLTLLEAPTTTTTSTTTTTTITTTKFPLSIDSSIKPTLQTIVASAKFELNLKYHKITEWFTQDDIIHLFVTNASQSTFSQYIKIDSNTGEIMKQINIGVFVNELRVIDNDFWVCSAGGSVISVLDSETLEVKQKFDLETKISSFDVYDKYIVYGSYERSEKIYRYNMETGVSSSVIKAISEFYSPEILINHKDNVVYIGERGVSDGKLYCYDLKNWECKSYYKHGYYDITGRMFLCDDGLYWRDFKFDPSDVSRVLCEYTSPEGKRESMMWVDDNYVVTTHGFYRRSTGEPLIYVEEYCRYHFAIVTKSGNVMWVKDSGNTFPYGRSLCVLKNRLK